MSENYKTMDFDGLMEYIKNQEDLSHAECIEIDNHIEELSHLFNDDQFDKLYCQLVEYHDYGS